MSTAELVTGLVMHHRLRHDEHRFSYKVFYVRLPLSALESAANALFSINGFNLASFHYEDHGARDGSHPLAWIRSILSERGLSCADGEVWLQSFPRVLGYVFNPVSFWFCEDREGRLRAVLAEVNNTFGETHSYLLTNAGGYGDPIPDGALLQARKVLHVSPFFDVSGGYRFRFSQRGSLRTARIDYHDEHGPALITGLAGHAAPLRAASLLRATLAHPLMTIVVIARIHWQGLRLWWRGVPLHPKPATTAPLEKFSP